MVYFIFVLNDSFLNIYNYRASVMPTDVPPNQSMRKLVVWQVEGHVCQTLAFI